MPVTVIEDESSMQTQLQKAGGKLVVVDFTATWCGPCKQMAPFFDELSKKYPQTVFLKVDVDDNSEIAMQYEVSAMPTFLFIRKQKEIDRVMGADPAGLENRIHSWGGPITSSQPATNISNSQVPPPQQPQPPPRPPSQQQMYITPGPIIDATGSIITHTHREPSSTSNNQQQQQQFGLTQNLPLPSNHNNLSGTQMNMTMSPPSQNIPNPGLNNYNPIPQHGPNLNLANMQQQQQIHPNYLPNYPPPPTQQNFYPQQQQPQQPSQQQQQYPIIHPSMAGYGNANNQAMVITNPQMQYEETTNNIGHMARDFRSNNSNNSNDENNDGGLPDLRERDEKDSQESERENDGRISSTTTATPTLASTGKEKREPRKRSSHRTRSTHRKDSHHSSSTNNQQNMSKINKDNEVHAQKALRVKKKLPTSTIQIRLADGTKLSANVNTSQPVSKIREFINNARPGNSTKPFVLMTIFPSREITNEDQSIQDAKLQNSVVVQRLT